MGRVAGPREGWGELLKYESDTAISSAHVQSYLWGGGCGGVVSIATPSIPSPKTKPKL